MFLVVGQLALLTWIVCGIATYVIADRRGNHNGVAWFVLGLLLGPLGIVVAIAARPDATLPGQVVDQGRDLRWFDYQGATDEEMVARSNQEAVTLHAEGFKFVYSEWRGRGTGRTLRTAYASVTDASPVDDSAGGQR